jgi:hypothetical protein
MTTIKARFDGQVFVPEGPVNLPAGFLLEIPIPAPSSSLEESTLIRLARLADQFPDNPNSPADLAEQHDHYLYGTPKKS